MRLRLALLLFGVLSVTRGVGCAYRTPRVDAPRSLPPLVVGDVWVDDGLEPAPADVTSSVREDVGQILAKASKDRTSENGVSPVTVRVQLGAREDYIANAGRVDGCGAASYALTVPAGTKTDSDSVWVAVAFTSGGRSYQGYGVGTKAGSVYVPARRRALAVALNDALARAAQSEPDHP